MPQFHRRAPEGRFAGMLALLWFSACAAWSPLVLASDDEPRHLGSGYHSIVRSAVTPWTSVETLAREAKARAQAFCARQDQQVEVLLVRDRKEWKVTGNTPWLELQFSCVAKSAASTTSSPSVPSATQVVPKSEPSRKAAPSAAEPVRSGGGVVSAPLSSTPHRRQELQH